VNTGTASSGDVSPRELRERLSYLHAQLASGIPANFMGALIVAALVSEVTPTLPLVLWVALVFAATVYRWVVRSGCPDFEVATVAELERAWWHVRLGIVLSGVAWGSGCVLAYPAESSLHQSAYVVVAAGMAAGAVPMLAVRLAPYAINCLCILIPLAARLIMHGDRTHIILGATTVILAGMMLRSARDFSRVFQDSGRLRARLAELAERDELTGLANRRCFDQAFEREWRAAARHGRSLAVMIIDVDHFKLYNDRYGHVAGDRCLAQVAAALNDGVARPADLVARMGGEEFVILLPDSTADGAFRVAERVRELVRGQRIPHGASPIGEAVTVSVGVASGVPRPGSDRVALLEQADRALYIAKDRGRDRVEVWQGMTIVASSVVSRAQSRG
jgi:diguanylate cyclase (GGDEF)-like protein